ncbi:hypothetical protein K2639_000809 [Salmonella enterica subsp. enterica serovar Kottbus]|nr:hypothetical protein [Salmonella enterica subsp. enterica serovar Kottbus]
MTGNLFLKSDARMHFAIANEDGNARMWLYKDKDGDGIRINNGVDGGGEFVFHKNGEFYSPVHLHAGGAIFGNNGDTYGAAWGNTWLSSWATNQFNARATIDWVNQNFPSNLRWGGISSTDTIHAASVDAPAGSAVVGVTLDVWGSRGTHVTQIRHRPLHKLINGAWVVIETW